MPEAGASSSGESPRQKLPSILARHLAHQGDEHAFSLLYLAAGAFCLYAAYGHGDSFCTDTPPSASSPFWGGVLAGVSSSRPRAPQIAAMRPSDLGELKNLSLSRKHSSAGSRRLLAAPGWETVWHASPALAVGSGQLRAPAEEAKLLFLAERPSPSIDGKGGSLGGDAASALAVGGFIKTLLFRDGKNQTVGDRVGGQPGHTAARHDTSGAGGKLGSLAESDDGDAESASTEGAALSGGSWAGRHGMVVLWLRVEGFTALFLPGVSMLMLGLGLQDSQCLSATLYGVALFQALCLCVGCVWSFGGFVPEVCTQGKVGDPFAYTAMWWVCAVWLGAIVSISTVICCILCCFVGAFVGQTNKEKQRHADDEV